ncbi:hypothetical protein V6N13_109270 [Hibiscus sabdariffa]
MWVGCGSFVAGVGDGECDAGGLGGVGAKLAVASGVRAGLSGMLAAGVGAWGSAAGLWWLADGVGMATWIGVASVSSIFHMYSFLVQPDRSGVNLSDGRLGTAARRHKAEIMQGKAKMPLSFWQESDNSLAITSPTLKWYSPISHCYCVFASSIVSIEFHHPIQISLGCFSAQSEPAEVEQPLVYDGFQAIVLCSVIEEETLFFPDLLLSNNVVVTCSGCYVLEPGGQVFDKGRR